MVIAVARLGRTVLWLSPEPPAEADLGAGASL